MRYNVVINQQKCRKYGLTVGEAVMMDLFNQLSSWADEEVIDGKIYYHISRNKVINELPFFFEKPDTVYRTFKSLSEKKLVEFKKEKRKDFIRLSTSGKGWNKLGNKSEFVSNTEINPAKLGKNSENENKALTPVDTKNLDPNSDLNPTYNIYNYTKDNSLIEILSKIEQDYPVIFESLVNAKSFHERIQITLKNDKLNFNIKKDIIPVLLHWLKNKWVGDDLDKPVTRLRTEAGSYIIQVIKNGGLTAGKKEEKTIVPVYLRKIS
jgi:hypothetical protein